MGLSRKKRIDPNLEILRNRLEDIVIKEGSLEAELPKDKLSPELKKTVDKLTKGQGLKVGRKKKEQLIDGHMLLTV